METFESTEMVPGRTARRVCLHCFCEMDLMPRGSRNCIFEGPEVRRKAISVLIVSLFTHLQKSFLTQTRFIYSKSPPVHERKILLQLRLPLPARLRLSVFCVEAVFTRCGGRRWSVEMTAIKIQTPAAGRDYWPRYCCVKTRRQ